MKNRNITLSLPSDLIDELHLLIKKGEVSRFVKEAILERLKAKKSTLEQQYIEASLDVERNEEAAQWDILAGDGLNEQNDW